GRRPGRPARARRSTAGGSSGRRPDGPRPRGDRRPAAL
ncbi:MAG: hypothetical protein AVDCRST_MAG48-3869, partial [uncultured Friedmanniella sp.]